MVFTRAYAQALVTTVSHATLLTGSYPAGHRVNDFRAATAGRAVYLPQLARRRLSNRGVRRLADPRSAQRNGARIRSRLRRLTRASASPSGRRSVRSVERRGEEVVTRASRLGLNSVRRLGAHRFCGCIYSIRMTRMRSAGRSDARFAAVAHATARDCGGRSAQVAAASFNPASPDTIVAIAADHGEALGDHGEEDARRVLHDAVLHVPLVIRVPGVAAGTRIDTRVRLADVAPTLLEAADCRFRGRCRAKR